MVFYILRIFKGDEKQTVLDYSSVLREEFNKHSVLENPVLEGSRCLATCSVLGRINMIGGNFCCCVTAAC